MGWHAWWSETRATRTLPPVVFALLVAGCATFQRRPLSPAQDVAAFGARSFADPGLRSFLAAHLHRQITPWPPPSLDWSALLLTALYYQPELELARTHEEVAEAAIVTAGAIPNPSLRASLGLISNPMGVSAWLYGLSLDVPIETAGKRDHRIARATHLATAARWNVADVAWQTRSRVLARLLDLHTAQEIRSRLALQVTTEEDLVGLLEARLAAGDVSRPEVTVARIALDRDRLALADARRQVEVARVQLAGAIGLPASALGAVELSVAVLERFPAIPPEALQREALQRRADILAALAEYEAAQASLQLEVARQYPDVHIGPGYGFDDSENKWTLGVSVTLPVFNRNQGPVKEAEARRREAAARFTALQARAIGEIDSARAAYACAVDKLETAVRLLSAQEAQVRAAEARLAAGQDDRLALLSTKLESSTAAVGRVQAFYQAQQALGLLEDAVQQDLRPDGAPATAPQSSPDDGPVESR